MAAANGFWDKGPASFDRGRFLEHTDDALKERLSSLSDDIVKELMSYPAIFAYELPTDEAVRVGNITSIRRRQGELRITFEFDADIPPITTEQFTRLLRQLDIEERFEIHRHHWAVKEVDLFEVLREAGLIKRAAVAVKREIKKFVVEGGQPAKKVFLVHGRNDGAKHEIARYLERLGLDVVILHERANGGRTLISKFQEESADINFAIVLMTPDDVGGVKGADEQRDRARQNVIFELGFFIGKLGAKNVCALMAGEIERPSDFEGVVYINYGPNTGWKLELARELREVGLPIDPEKIF